jgi:ABC-type bacteriocin/lantibiotic exporter with double-glycine peptidase domain
MSQSETATLEAKTDTVLAVPEGAQRIRLEGVSFFYEKADAPAIREISLDIELGTTVAFVGESGSGKSTVVDLVLGLMEPTSGRILIDETPLAELRHSWRSRVAYVPQEVALFDATIAQNVALTWEEDLDRKRVKKALQRAHLWSVVGNREGGIDAPIGERGLALSGGQRQRLGIARALYTEPLVLVMDEATSALDGRTEASISASIAQLEGIVTTLIVAHLLSTMKHADTLLFR